MSNVLEEVEQSGGPPITPPYPRRACVPGRVRPCPSAKLVVGSPASSDCYPNIGRKQPELACAKDVLAFEFDDLVRSEERFQWLLVDQRP